MARFSPVYSSLKLRLEEVKRLISLAEATENGRVTGANMATVDALCRGGIVLMSSHLEGYVKGLAERGLEMIEKNHVPKEKLEDVFRYHLSRDLIAEIQQSIHPDSISSRITAFLERDMQIWNTDTVFVGPLPRDAFIGGVAAPNHDGIKKLFGRFGYSTFEGDLGKNLKGDLPVCRNMVDQIVDLRNKIAHGDPRVGATPQDIRDMQKWLMRYCQTTDKVVCDWFKGIGCTLRQ